VWNRTKVTTDSITNTLYTTNNINEYTQVDGYSQTFDDNGNLKASGLHGQSFSATYDYENRPTQMVYGQTTVDFKYDVFGRRIEKKVGNNIVRFFYDYQKPIEEIDDAGTPNVLAKYIFGPGINEILVMERDVYQPPGKEKYYYHDNAIGTIVGISTASKTTAQEPAYDIYGKPYTNYTRSTVLTSSALSNPFLFTGAPYDFETGMYYFRARYYDPWQGRFLQRDPLYIYKATELLDKNASSSNLYQYVRNNSVNYIDPKGLTVTVKIIIEFNPFESCADQCWFLFGEGNFGQCMLDCSSGGGGGGPWTGGCTVDQCTRCCQVEFMRGKYKDCPPDYPYLMPSLQSFLIGSLCPLSKTGSCLCPCCKRGWFLWIYWLECPNKYAYCYEEYPGEHCPGDNNGCW
jgi:RHS repeat-associated protein